MPSGKRKVSRRKKIRKFLRFAAVVAVICLIASVFYLAVTIGPRSPDSSAPRATAVADDSLVEESRSLFARFETAVGERAPTQAEVEMLKRAISLQREYNAAGFPSREHRLHLEEMEQWLSSIEAGELATRSLGAEETADLMESAGNREEVLSQINLAWELQREINTRYGRTAYRDTARETRLHQRKTTLETEPVFQSSRNLEEKGLAAAENRQWDEARRLLSEARALQMQINDLGRRNPFHDGSRLDRLSEAIAGLRVGEMASQVEEWVERASVLEREGSYQDAAQLYEEALILQNQINRDHPQSPFVSLERFTELDLARQRALSGPLTGEINDALASLRTSLREGDLEAAMRHHGTARARIRQMDELFPRGTLIELNVRLELEFLANVHDQLPQMQASLLEGLVPLPRFPGWRMHRTEVSQRLYRQIMNANPSRNAGDDLPVDSVTHSQARDFCRRAGWILGREAVLPSRVHFEAALGDGESGERLPSGDGGDSGPFPVDQGRPNSHGFVFLVGNLAQWLADETDGGRGLTGGGALSRTSGPNGIFREVSRTERSPEIGFRHMVGGW